ncbi:MAG: MFS transporter [Clostridia bacterium]|nr:MFS transporter [Clostridia bacterium]MBR5427573.1 MFS transporter [Clostridia bacterium]
MSKKNGSATDGIKLNYKRTFLIGTGFMSCMLLWSVYNSYVPVMLRQKLTESLGGDFRGLGFVTIALIVNAIMTIDNVFGVIFLPFFGKRSDRVKAKNWGKRMPFILICMPISAVFFCFVPVAAIIKDIALSILLMMSVVILFNFTMSIWRSPVVSLMPDFTPSHLQSDANAVINIMGGIGQMVGFVVGTIAATVVGLVGFSTLSENLKAKTNTLGQILALDADGNVLLKWADGVDKSIYEGTRQFSNFLAQSKDKLIVDGQTVCEKAVKLGADGQPIYVNYVPVFIVTALIALICLGILAIFYKKNRQYDITATEDAAVEEKPAEKKISIRNLDMDKSKKRSLIIMLLALFLLNNATEAIIPNFTNFANDTLQVPPIYSTLMMAVFAVSLAAFGIPAGTMGRKLGRKKTIMIGLLGIVIMFAIYITVSQILGPSEDGSVNKFTWVCLWVALIVGGAAVGCVNINTLPLVLAMGGREHVGTFTGYYYTATQAASITGPILCGLVIGLFHDDYNYMFLYCAVMFAIGLVAMIGVKHGESTDITEEDIKQARMADD